MYIFQEDIQKGIIRQTGCEKFDSLYQLYRIFQKSDYFLFNLFIAQNEKIIPDNLLKLLIDNKISACVVRCEKQIENHPVSAKAFQNIIQNKDNLFTYIQQKLNDGNNCIIHEVIQTSNPSNRLDWVYSFGIWYNKNLPHIEVYPATDASSIKWGKLSPLYLINLDENMTESIHIITDPNLINQYQQTKLSEWTEQFSQELGQNSQYTSLPQLTDFLQKNNHYLFNLKNVEKKFLNTKKTLIDIALKYAFYAGQNNININNHIIHGSLLFNDQMIIWDISSDKRWNYLKK